MVEDLEIGTWRAGEPDRPRSRAFDASMARAVQRDIDRGIMDSYIGSRLQRRFEELGLADIEATCRLSLERGGSALSRFWHDTLAVDARDLVADGCLTKEQVTGLLQSLLDSGFYYYPPAVIAMRGRKPATA